MKNKEEKEEIETLDFENPKPSLDDTVEMLDFEADKKVSDEIDEMLDFIDVKETKDSKENQALEKLLEENDNEKNKIEIDGSKEKLDEYKPSIKDFNIKSAKTRKIVKKSMLYVIIVMLIGFELFINKTGDALNSLRVYASDNQPIRIVQNEKYGYIDFTGDKIVNPKYSYGEEFIKGYAIVKNSSNLPLIIDKGGKEVVPTGEYFSLFRAGTDIIASKSTKKGLKYGILDSDLKEKTPFEYDSIAYKNGVYSYVNGNMVGLINSSGKDIFEYKLTDEDDKQIEVNPCKVTNDDYQRYGVVTINSSSQIVNLNDGTVVSSPTLNEITPEENNVFYEVTSNGTKRYLYVQDNKVLVESESYNSLTIPSIETGILRAINTSYEYEYISTKTLEQVKKGLTEDEVFYGDDIFIYYEHNYRRNTRSIILVKNGEIFKTIEADFDIYKAYKNGVAIVRYSDGTYGYLNSDGELINDTHYLEAEEFDSYGEAIAKTDGGYGVINSDGKVIIEFENEEVKDASSKVKTLSGVNNNNVFYAVKKESKFTLHDKNGKRINKTRYNNVIFDEDYPIIKIATDEKDALLTTEDENEINLTSFNMEYEAHENYIIVKNEYYNYSGKLIYVDNSKTESGDS